MLDDDFKTEVIKHMATQTANQGNIEDWMEKLDGKVNKLETKGCAKGAENERRLDKIEATPGRSALVGATSGGGIAAALFGAVKIIENVLIK